MKTGRGYTARHKYLAASGKPRVKTGRWPARVRRNLRAKGWVVRPVRGGSHEEQQEGY